METAVPGCPGGEKMSATRTAVFSREALHRAWLDCRRRKRATSGAVAFEMRLADELGSLAEELRNRVYFPRPAVRFATHRPKLREIVAAQFRDRVVHHLFVRAVEADWERVFIHDSFACRKGKGTHAAVDRLEQFVRAATAGGSRRAWYLQLDVKSFFMSIDRSVLFARLDRRLRRRFGLATGSDPVGGQGTVDSQQLLPFSRPGADPAFAEDIREYEPLRWLARLLVFHDPLDRCETRGDKALLDRVPPHKTLAGCAPGRGLPIGNLTSQFFANVYLDALDELVKHELRARWYIRYVDDLVLIHEKREILESWHVAIGDFLARVLRLELNPNRTRLRPVSSGIDFLGYVVHPDHRLARRRVIGNLREKLSRAEKRLVRKGPGGSVILGSSSSEHDRLTAVLDSYLAHFAKADAYRLTRSFWRRYRWLGIFVGLAGNKVVRRDRPRQCPRRLSRQYAWFARRAHGGALFFQVGSHYELQNEQARKLGPLLGLRSIASRPGFSHRSGFHRKYLERYLDMVVKVGLPVTVVGEGSRRGESIKERRIVARIMPKVRFYLESLKGAVP